MLISQGRGGGDGGKKGEWAHHGGTVVGRQCSAGRVYQNLASGQPAVPVDDRHAFLPFSFLNISFLLSSFLFLNISSHCVDRV